MNLLTWCCSLLVLKVCLKILSWYICPYSSSGNYVQCICLWILTGYARPLVDRIDAENRFSLRLYRPSTISTWVHLSCFQSSTSLSLRVSHWILTKLIKQTRALIFEANLLPSYFIDDWLYWSEWKFSKFNCSWLYS